jgi:site-specific recombinase XerD
VNSARKQSPAIRAGYLAGRTPANAGRTYPAEILTPAEVQTLIRACSSRAPTGVRNRALLVTLYRGGLRLSEALALFPKDLDARAGTITVLHGKGDRRRTIGLDPGAFAVVDRWLEKRAKLGISPRGPLFCTLDGRRLDDSYVRRLLRRLGERCGIHKRVHPHGLRHTHAAELAAENLPANLIQAQLGHGSLATTDRYLRHIAPQQLIDVIRRREWDTSSLPDAGELYS